MFGSFFKGAMAGLLSGVVMALVIASISPLLITAVPGAAVLPYFTAFGEALVHSGGFMVVASTLFGGIMRAGRTMFEAPGHSNAFAQGMVPVPVPGMSGPAMAPVMTYADAAPEQQEAPTKSWVAETRNADARNTIEQILANGSMSDKDRASAIREVADQQTSRA
jgi:hypothetical protein